MPPWAAPAAGPGPAGRPPLLTHASAPLALGPGHAAAGGWPGAGSGGGCCCCCCCCCCWPDMGSGGGASKGAAPARWHAGRGLVEYEGGAVWRAQQLAAHIAKEAPLQHVSTAQASEIPMVGASNLTTRTKRQEAPLLLVRLQMHVRAHMHTHMHTHATHAHTCTHTHTHAHTHALTCTHTYHGPQAWTPPCVCPGTAHSTGSPQSCIAQLDLLMPHLPPGNHRLPRLLHAPPLTHPEVLRAVSAHLHAHEHKHARTSIIPASSQVLLAIMLVRLRAGC